MLQAGTSFSRNFLQVGTSTRQELASAGTRQKLALAGTRQELALAGTRQELALVGTSTLQELDNKGELLKNFLYRALEAKLEFSLLQEGELSGTSF